jgi:hypothetical protein
MKYVVSRFFKFTYILNNNNNKLLLDSNIRNSVCTPAKLPCRRVEVRYKYLHIYIQFLTNIQENETTTIDHFYLNN